MRGKLKHWVPLNRYGWIRSDDDGADIFVHLRQFTDCRAEPLSIGTRLEFEIGTHQGRPCAVDVREVLE